MPVADICDAHADRVQVLDLDFQHFTDTAHFSGPCRLFALHAADAFLAEQFKQDGAGAVALVSVAVRPHVAVFGDGMARNAEANGWAGVVIEGSLRDIALIEERKIGIIATGIAPRISRNGPVGYAASELMIGGVLVRAGDWIVADGDGLICIGKDLAASLGADIT
jgi:regulator of ribonuclease activity A